MRMHLLVLLLFMSTAHAEIDFSGTDPAPGNMRFKWIHGSISAKANTDVRVQVHRYNEHTYILRQNPAIDWEGPFMYLLIGNKRAVLIDAGATEEAAYFPLRATVDQVIARWQSANGIAKTELIVIPLGGDNSQIGALAQFADRPATKVVYPQAAARQGQFGADWPKLGRLDLGGRVLDVMPTPGLDANAISLYDPWTDVLFTGNTFYPGRLVIRDFAAYRATLKRLTQFKKDHPVAWIAGGRIEMTDTPRMAYRMRENYRPREHLLELDPAVLDDGLNIVQLINGSKDIRLHDDFIVMNGVGRGAQDSGYPVFVPKEFRKPNPI